NKAVITVL
ncbi:hypothetical protein D049_2869B, partial [Vibrio parahaemolyticus VPTS-2010]